jgi:hypothetical protein
VGILVGLGFANAGLIASTLHPGHPERAWRAFSQWRSSWLSREGVASLITFPPAIAFAVLWWVLGPDAPATRTLGIIAAVLGLLTVGCTAMIYASLKPIRRRLFVGEVKPHAASGTMLCTEEFLSELDERSQLLFTRVTQAPLQAAVLLLGDDGVAMIRKNDHQEPVETRLFQAPLG